MYALIGLLALLGVHARPWLSTAGVARRVEWAELVLIGFNDDIHTRASNLAEVLAAGPDVIFIQEGRVEDYRQLRDPPTGKRLLPYDEWAVHQDTSTPARAGSVVAYRHDSGFTRTGAGWTFGVKAPGLMARWIAWIRGLLAGRKVFLFSAHRPPMRVRRWWHPFDLALWARLRLAVAAGRLILGQMDSNEHGGPRGVPAALKVVGVPGSIDVFVFSRQVEVLEGPTELPLDTSDHHPIRTRVRVPLTTRSHAA